MRIEVKTLLLLVSLPLLLIAIALIQWGIMGLPALSEEGPQRLPQSGASCAVLLMRTRIASALPCSDRHHHADTDDYALTGTHHAW